jgi:hypothetical protein
MHHTMLKRLDLSNRSEQGSTLLLTAVLIVGLAGASLALLTTTDGNLKSERRMKEEVSAQLVAEAAICDAFLELKLGGDGELGTATAPVNYGDATYFVDATDVNSDVKNMTATARSGLGQCRIEMVVEKHVTPFFQYAAFGDTFLNMDSNAKVDSYDSNLGTYASQVSGSGSSAHAAANGDIGSNGNILMKQNSKTWGDAAPGPGMTTTVLGNAVLAGTSNPQSKPKELPPVVVPVIPSTGSLTAGNQTLPAGSYHFTNLVVSNNKVLTVNGPATIVADNLQLKSNSQLKINASNGPVTVYVIDDFKLESNAIAFPTSQKPGDLTFKLQTDNIQNPDLIIDLDDVVLNSNTKVWGTIYAPNAKIEVDSNFELFGAIIASELDLDSNSFVHFDEQLLNQTSGGTTTWERLAWRIID